MIKRMSTYVFTETQIFAFINTLALLEDNGLVGGWVHRQGHARVVAELDSYTDNYKDLFKLSDRKIARPY